MSLLQDLIQEMDGATCAGSIAAYPGAAAGKVGTLFAGGVIDGSKKKKKKSGAMIRRLTGLGESLGVDLGNDSFDASDVLSRIDAASKKEEQNEGTTAFGLEDEDGNMVKVFVRDDQAKDFEQHLAGLLANEDNEDNEETTAMEIAEVLFKLKDQFDIVDVEWPGIEPDEEEPEEAMGSMDAGSDTSGMPGGDMSAEGGEMPPGDAEVDIGDEEDSGMEDEGGGMEDEDAAKTALTQVIDMMKADAEAKKAEADARAAEARAKEAELSGHSAAARVRKEEQILDMESAEKEKTNQEKEAKQLAKLARHQHQKAQDAEVRLSMESNDVVKEKSASHPWKINNDKELSLEQLSNLILRNLGHN